MKIDMRSIYTFNPVAFEGPLPSGGDIYYECTCGSIVSSVSFIKTACDCGNLSGGQGNITVQEPGKVKPLRGKLR
jgi:hypothetical protein